MDQKVAKVKDYPSLRKTGGAVINVDNREFNIAKARVSAAKRTKSLESQVQQLTGKLDEVMNLLGQLAARLD